MADEEVVMSVEETNRLRASLGLKPLSVGPSATAPKPKPKEEPKAADPEELRRKLAESRDKRRREAELRSTQTLGAAAADVDDVASWISKIKPGQQQQQDKSQGKPQQQQQQRKRSRPAAGDGEAGDEQDGEQDGGSGYGAADLAGLSVKHNLSEMVEGETVVLTLADTGILDEKGNLADGPDQLENALAAQEKARRRARAAATKTAKPLWEEDGRVRGLLDKYDEEEEEAAAAFDAAGNLAQQQRRQAELHSKLAAGAAALFGGADGEPQGAAAGGSDYYTAEEAAAAAAGGKDGKKKKKKRKLRTTKVSGEGEEAGGGLDLDALEAAAAAEGADDLGSRQEREQRRKQQEEARAAAAAERAARFETALGRANIASEALRGAAPGAAATNGAAGAGAAAGGDEFDEADDELAASLARARRLANKAAAAAAGGGGGGDGGSFEEVARRIAASREEDEQKLKEQLAAGTVEAFNETTEFVRAIQVKQELIKPEDEAAAAAAGGSSYMDVDDLPPPPPPPPAAAAAAAAADAAVLPPPPDAPPAAAAGQSKQRQQRQYRKGGWVSAEGDEQEDQVMQDADGDASQQQQQKQQRAPELEDTGVVGERAMGKGLAACLGLIKEKGLLKDKTQWAGRTNDKKPVALIGLDDVYTGGSHEDSMSQRIEVALTQRDEFGRVMTPKERFRVMCHQFHGKPPSKNKQEERQRKYLEELAVARATTSDNPSAELDKLRELQRSTGAAFIPLTGRAKPGAAVRDPLADVGAGDASRIPATPMLGGGMTPLSGSRKVEMMLGISKPGAGAGSMPPPAPRR